MTRWVGVTPSEIHATSLGRRSSQSSAFTAPLYCEPTWFICPPNTIITYEREFGRVVTTVTGNCESCARTPLTIAWIVASRPPLPLRYGGAVPVVRPVIQLAVLIVASLGPCCSVWPSKLRYTVRLAQRA